MLSTAYIPRSVWRTKTNLPILSYVYKEWNTMESSSYLLFLQADRLFYHTELWFTLHLFPVFSQNSTLMICETLMILYKISVPLLSILFFLRIYHYINNRHFPSMFIIENKFYEGVLFVCVANYFNFRV